MLVIWMWRQIETDHLLQNAYTRTLWNSHRGNKRESGLFTQEILDRSGTQFVLNPQKQFFLSFKVGILHSAVLSNPHK